MANHLSIEKLAQFAPRPGAGKYRAVWDDYLVALTSEEAVGLFAAAGIDTRDEFCAFMANAAQETGDHGAFTCLWENMTFTSVAAVRTMVEAGKQHVRCAELAELGGRDRTL